MDDNKKKFDQISQLIEENNILKERVKNLQSEIFRWETIINTLPNCIYVKDLEGRYVWINDASSRQVRDVHLIEDSIIGKTDFDVFPNESAEIYNQNDREVIFHKKGTVNEEVVELFNGQQLTQLSFKEPLLNKEGKLIGILGYTIDITDLKKVQQELITAKEAAESANRAKTQFLENMRHDIRTPLTGVVGVSDLLRLKIKDENIEIDQLMQIMQESAYALLDFLDEILEAVRVMTGEAPIVKKRFELKPILESVLKLNQAAARHKHLSLDFEYDEQLSRPFLGDPDRIKRIVLELLTNAIKFTHEGSVKLIAKKVGEKEGSFIVALKISDTGIGIPKDQQSEIYNRFSRLTPSHQGVYKGAGLGLFIIKGYIDALNGELSVESDPTKEPGTTFKCLLPLEPALPELIDK